MRQNIAHFPKELKAQNYWLLGNKNKIPVLPHSSLPITGNRLDHCQSWQETETLLLGNSSHHYWAVYLHNQQEPFTSVDIDKARDPKTGITADWCQNLFNRITEQGSIGYVEISSSQTGYHMLCAGKPVDAQNQTFGKRLYHPTNKRGKSAGKIEIIARNNLITYTGNVLPDCQPEQLANIQIVMNYLNETFPEQCPQYNTNTLVSAWNGVQQNDWLDKSTLIELLDHINPDCDHDQWKQIGMAIHDWSDSHEAREIWHLWSSTGSSYDQLTARAINSAWKSFNPGKTTIATVVQLAKNNGWQKKKISYPPAVVQVRSGQAQMKQLPEDDSHEMTTSQHTTGKIILDDTQAATEQHDNVAVFGNITENVGVLVERYNKIFVHTMIKGKNFILQLKKDDEFNQLDWDAMSIPEFKIMMIHEPCIPVCDVENKDKVKFQPPANVWLNHQYSNFVRSTTFWPVYNDEFPPLYEGKLNLYRGLATEPENSLASDTSMKVWIDHIKQVICRNNEQTFNYLLNWFAHMIQYPEEKPETAIIIKGEHGTGKNTAILPLLEIIGVHCLYIEKPGIITGRFNSILENKIFVFADEAVFKSQGDANVLKAIITEKRSMFERKGMDAYSRRNFTRIIMSTNDENPVQISSDERRYLLLETDNKYKQNHVYFNQLIDAIGGKFPSKLLYFLQHRDISEFQPRQVPKTEFLTDGKIHNLEPEQAFIYESLSHGSFILNAGWPANVETTAVQTWFREWLDKCHLRFQGDAGRKLGKVIAQIGGKRYRHRDINSRSYLYKFEDLEVSRNKFEKIVMFGSVIPWEPKE